MKSFLVRCVLALLVVAPVYCATVTRTTVVHSTSRAATADDDKLLKVHFIDVGGGDGILIDTPRPKKILIDGSCMYTEQFKAARSIMRNLMTTLPSSLCSQFICLILA